MQESKRAFFYSIVTEGGDKEKLEAFVNFCEDAIFEMTHASGLMAVVESSGGGKAREASYSYMTEEDEERWVPSFMLWFWKTYQIIHLANQEKGLGNMEVYFSFEFLTYIIYAYSRAARDPIQRGIQTTKDTLYFCMAMLSPSHIKAKINELQQMTIPEIFIAFFKMIFYAFYYSGFGVSIVIR